MLQNVEQLVNKVAQHVQDSGYEYSDYKLTFSISSVAPLKRFYIISNAELEIKEDFRQFDRKAFRSNLDFKEVFKWIISPHIARKLDIPANLEGSFLVNCTFVD